MIPSQTLSEPVPELSFDPKSAIYVPLGAASPFWFLYAGAASAGLAYWWLSRWRGVTNVEALFGQALVPVETAAAAVEEVVAEIAEPILEAEASVSELIAAPEPEAKIPEPVSAAEPETPFVAVAELLSEPESAVEAATVIEPEPLLEPVMEAALDTAAEAAPAKPKSVRAARAAIDDPA